MPRAYLSHDTTRGESPVLEHSPGVKGNHKVPQLLRTEPGAR